MGDWWGNTWACASEQTATFNIVYEGPYTESWDIRSEPIDFCYGVITVDVPQCAHWQHVIEPSPYDPQDPRSNLEDVVNDNDPYPYEDMVDLVEDGRLAAGVGITLA